MICAYCKMVRAENTAPCSNCGAPSPIKAISQNVQREAPREGEQFSHQQNSNTAIPSSSSWQASQSWSQSPQAQQWGQTPQAQQGNSFLPVPYQGGMGLQQVPLSNAMQIMTAPAQDITIAPPEHEEGVVYVPPMYTKPRPIIPRYRIISGFLSVIIVSLMLCGGAGYYAKASGKLDMVSRVLTGNNAAPSSIRTTAPPLPDPPDTVDIGNAAAYNAIPSATTTLHLIKNTTVAAETDRIFKPNVIFYLIYSVHPPQAGTVTVKWYMSNMQLPYSVIPGQLLPAQQIQTGVIPMRYSSQAEGKVELYWNNQRAQTLYFVVRN